MAEEQKVIPTGSLPPEPEVKETAPPPEPVEEKVYAGKYKSPEDLEKAYGEIGKKYGQQSQQVGELSKQNQELAQRLEAIEKQNAELSNPPKTDYEAELRALNKQYDEGEIEIGELLLRTNAITRQQTLAEADQKYGNILDQASNQFQQTLSERDAQAQANKFHEQNPEFNQWAESGELDAMKESNPMLDDLSAFYALKAAKAFEAGKEETLRLKSGSEEAGKVLSKPGNSIQQANKPKERLTGSALKASMLEKARAAAES